LRQRRCLWLCPIGTKFFPTTLRFVVTASFFINFFGRPTRHTAPVMPGQLCNSLRTHGWRHGWWSTDPVVVGQPIRFGWLCLSGPLCWKYVWQFYDFLLPLSVAYFTQSHKSTWAACFQRWGQTVATQILRPVEVGRFLSGPRLNGGVADSGAEPYLYIMDTTQCNG
jgi:hypothetical protein